MTYSEAVDYILEIPKFTKKNDAGRLAGDGNEFVAVCGAKYNINNKWNSYSKCW